ncbi:Glucans biosynthesis glucosyltransferase H [Rubripirellula obstinata]|uniref:Glucans biosynthesis glucosyltransferase H n=2 Tax=Rubripirellula obstinata TaxID=406547 RepID=A0A5B1CL68_9BACT|nr:Glucans biosynthesis glucosyltransferase H [Rubripirellula obstinata]
MILLTALGSASGILVYAMNLARNGWNPFELLALPLFAILFTWIVFSFVLATRGFFASLTTRSEPLVLEPGVSQPTAVLVPVYNESPDDVFARVHAMVLSLQQHDADSGSERAGDLHFYILSDTTDPEIWLAEELAWSRLNRQLATEQTDCMPSIFYRHRAKNEGRKAGNIADFCERWSKPYDCMIILDADSLLEPTTILSMVDAMAADPKLGILQVPPVPIGRTSLFARLQQFSAAAYGQICCRGFDAWAGDQGNYWGHNAILRIKAFRESCDLPVLPGKAPLGGEILSHDFVEAALMVRDGWKVRLANDLAGSYEECPTTLTDYAMRDQRWCQGNLQHSRFIVSEGFHWVSRLHFVSGVLAYAASPLWLAWTALSVAGWGFDSRQSPNNIDLPGPLALFLIAMCLLLIPKFYGMLAIVIQKRASQFGGVIQLFTSVLIETAISVLLSPLMALLHSRFVINTLRGRKITWNAQNRCEQGVTLKESIADYGWQTVLGVLVASSIFVWATPLALWFIPVVAGLIFAVPISMILASQSIGKVLAEWGLLMTPQESSEPFVSQVYRQTLADYSASQESNETTRFEQLLRSPGFYILHDRVLGASESNVTMPRPNRDRVLAAAKESIGEISPQWRRSILSDQELLKDLHVIAQLDHDSL